MSKYQIHKRYYIDNEWQTERIVEQKFESFEQAQEHMFNLGVNRCEDFYHFPRKYYSDDWEFPIPIWTIHKVCTEEILLESLKKYKVKNGQIFIPQRRGSEYSYREILESIIHMCEHNKDTDWTQTDVSEEFQAIIEYINIRMSKVESTGGAE